MYHQVKRQAASGSASGTFTPLLYTLWRMLYLLLELHICTPTIQANASRKYNGPPKREGGIARAFGTADLP